MLACDFTLRGHRCRHHFYDLRTFLAGRAGSKEIDSMQVLCKSSDQNVETHCSVCGQGFVLFWERVIAMEKDEALKEIEKTLREHHLARSGADAHPEHGFLVPEWDGPIAFSGAAILSNAPVWAL
jgi:hypothetical protein